MKIAFLFLIVSNIYHESIWLNFFNHHQNQYSIYIHSKESMPNNSAFKQFELPTKIPTSWTNTMDAQMELLREALKDKDNQKFIFLSETTIPIQTFDFVYETLMASSKSQFDFAPNHISGRFWESIESQKAFKNSQWVVLNRKHAELMVKDNSIINIMTKEDFDNEHYPSTFLYLQGLLHEEVEQIDRTLVIWSEYDGAHPFNFVDLEDTKYAQILIDAIKEKTHLFARKFHIRFDLSCLRPYLSSTLLD